MRRRAPRRARGLAKKRTRKSRFRLLAFAPQEEETKGAEKLAERGGSVVAAGGPREGERQKERRGGGRGEVVEESSRGVDCDDGSPSRSIGPALLLLERPRFSARFAGSGP